MARTPTHQISQVFLPPIQTRTTSYDDAFQGVRHYRPSSQIIAASDPKLAELETRLDYQEKTTQQLLDRAVRIKQDLMENLTYTKGTWQEEKQARELLQEHVRTITAVVRQMNKEIKSFETEVKEKENSINGTGNAIKTLESHHVAGITDLRGRVARCDAALAKLSGDIRQANDSIRQTNGMQQADSTKVVERIQQIDGKLSSIQRQLAEAHNRLERLSSEHALNLKLSEEGLSKGIYDLESRTKQTVDELRNQITNASCTTSSDVEKLESRIAANIEKNMNFRDVRMEKLDADHHEFSKSIQDRLSGYEKDHTGFKIHVAKIHQDFETRLNQYSEKIHRQQTEDLQRLKREMREGFGTVHDTINNMKSVMEGKQKLLEENLRREMAQIRKMVVLI